MLGHKHSWVLFVMHWQALFHQIHAFLSMLLADIIISCALHDKCVVESRVMHFYFSICLLAADIMYPTWCCREQVPKCSLRWLAQLDMELDGMVIWFFQKTLMSLCCSALSACCKQLVRCLTNSNFAYFWFQHCFCFLVLGRLFFNSEMLLTPMIAAFFLSENLHQLPWLFCFIQHGNDRFS